MTSNPTRTSPVKRGKWVPGEHARTPPPPPPPDVPELARRRKRSTGGSLRQRMEQHRAKPDCAVCHQKMDPLGFGFENFDAHRRLADEGRQVQIDPSGTLPDGRTFNGPAELQAILERPAGQFRPLPGREDADLRPGPGARVSATAVPSTRSAERSQAEAIQVLRPGHSRSSHSDPFQKRRRAPGDGK